MSHVAVMKTEVKSLSALKAACKKLGLEFRENQHTYRWYNTWVNDYGAEDAAYKNGVKPEDYGKNSTHAIGIPGNDHSYEIGVVQEKDEQGNPIESYKLVWDFWSGGKGLDKFIGNEKGNKLITAYTQELFRETYEQQGYEITETTDQNGYLVLEAHDYAYVG
jgi:hypothetical protein